MSTNRNGNILNVEGTEVLMPGKASPKALSNSGVADEDLSIFMYHVTRPKDHKDHMTQAEAAEKVGGNVPALRARAFSALQNMYTKVFLSEISQPQTAPVARTASITTEEKQSSGKGRKPGTPNRPKEEIEAERRAKAIRAKARENVGLQPQGRIPDEVKEKYKAEVKKLEKEDQSS